MKLKELKRLLKSDGKRLKANRMYQVRYMLESNNEIELLENHIHAKHRERSVHVWKTECCGKLYYDVIVSGAWTIGWDG